MIYLDLLKYNTLVAALQITFVSKCVRIACRCWRELRQLNREHGTTFIVVTHNPAVARAADRIVAVRDGRVKRDEKIGNVYLEDLREFKESALGHAILDGNVPAELNGLELEQVAEPVREMLKKV